MSSYDSDFTPDSPTPAYHSDFVPDAPESGLAAGAMAGVRGAAKGLDYQRGAVLSGFDRVRQALGGKSAFQPGEMSAALSPLSSTTAPSWGKELEAMGIPKGPTTRDIPRHAGLLGVIAQHFPEVSARGAAGLGLDVAADPMTYESGLLGRIAEALKDVPVASQAAGALSRVSSAVSDAGKAAAAKTYESGIAPIIKAAKSAGNPDVGATMLEHGIWGTPSSIREGMEDASSARKGFKDAILEGTQEAGGSASKDAAITPTFQQLKQMVEDQRLTPDQASRILQDLTQSKQVGSDRVAPTLMDTWKTDERNALPGTTYNEVKMQKPTIARQLRQELGSGYQKEVEGSVARTFGEPVADMYSENNTRLGDLINRKGKKAASGEWGSAIPSLGETAKGLGLGAMAAGVGHVAGFGSGQTAEGTAALLAALLAGKVASSTPVRTGAGVLGTRLLNIPGASPALDAVSRRFINSQVSSPYVVPAKPKEGQ